MPSITPINPGDPLLDRNALDRRYTRARLVRHLLNEGVRRTPGRAFIYPNGGTPLKRVILDTYIDAIKAAPSAVESEGGSHPDVRIVKRVLLKGKDCADSYSHTVGLELIDGGTRVRVLQDGECDPEDTEKFHTTLAGLKAAIAALEAQV